MTADAYLNLSHQVPEEIDAFIDILRAADVRSFLEIGSKFGSTLWRVASSMPLGSRVVSVDLGVNGPSLPACVKALRARTYDAEIIVGNSIDPLSVAEVRKRGPFDAIFIDGNHKLMYVKQDWENYGPMTKIVGFHDIGWRRATPAKPNRIVVPEFWNSIKDGYRHQEILLDPTGNANGIGVIWR